MVVTNVTNITMLCGNYFISLSHAKRVWTELYNMMDGRNGWKRNWIILKGQEDESEVQRS